MSLAEKVVIVTGSSRGIGKAMALGLAEEGAYVVVAARSEESRPMLPGTIHSTVGEILAAKDVETFASRRLGELLPPLIAGKIPPVPIETGT